jgi:3-keto-L-gulonate-6-phosphate decarboxylase
MAQSTVLFCADVMIVEEKIKKQKKRGGNMIPESQFPVQLEESQDKDADQIFVHHSIDKEENVHFIPSEPQTMLTPSSDLVVNLDVQKLNQMAEDIKKSQGNIAHNFELIDN